MLHSVALTPRTKNEEPRTKNPLPALALVTMGGFRDTIGLQRIRKLAQPTRSSGAVV